MIIRIKNLRLRTVIGVLEWERKTRQEVVLNIALEFDGARAARTDDLKDTLDYAGLKHRVVEAVEKSKFRLLEKLADAVLRIVMSDPRVLAATVESDKPGALHLADSVSVTCSAKRKRLNHRGHKEKRR